MSHCERESELTSLPVSSLAGWGPEVLLPEQGVTAQGGGGGQAGTGSDKPRTRGLSGGRHLSAGLRGSDLGCLCGLSAPRKWLRAWSDWDSPRRTCPRDGLQPGDPRFQLQVTGLCPRKDFRKRTVMSSKERGEQFREEGGIVCTRKEDIKTLDPS